MGEENWPENVIRSNGVWGFDQRELGGQVVDGPRSIICADCGKPIMDGLVFHLKPEVYAIIYEGETYYLERHIGLSCGCAAKRGLA